MITYGDRVRFIGDDYYGLNGEVIEESYMDVRVLLENGEVIDCCKDELELIEE